MATDTSTTWPIKDALEKCFPDAGRRVALSTVHSWLQRDLFQPVRVTRKRGPGGHRVDLADLVTISVLRALFEVGVSLDTFKIGKRRRPGHIIGSGRFTSRRVFMNYDGLGHDDAEQIETSPRPIQSYFEVTQYQCWVRLVVETSHRVYFEQIDPLSHFPLQRTDLVAFLCIRAHYEYVLDRMS